MWKAFDVVGQGRKVRKVALKNVVGNVAIGRKQGEDVRKRGAGERSCVGTALCKVFLVSIEKHLKQFIAVSDFNCCVVLGH